MRSSPSNPRRPPLKAPPSLQIPSQRHLVPPSPVAPVAASRVRTLSFNSHSHTKDDRSDSDLESTNGSVLSNSFGSDWSLSRGERLGGSGDVEINAGANGTGRIRVKASNILNGKIRDTPGNGKSSGRGTEEARNNRKMLDLEISNKSLMAINENLEALVRKQANEISRLKKRIARGDSYNSLDTPLSEDTEFDFDLTEDEQDEDFRFKRLCITIDTLIKECKSALALERKAGGGKVLSPFDTLDKDPLDEAVSIESTFQPIT
ncbi:uncharacterized protein VTP21DRAFT_6762 [Calcarisporiella thermophila]|uniref:uncharacterized protein n=1 Tax=Calcarisporiella thermophila TaxID=911321 RepID=UPI0037425926